VADSLARLENTHNGGLRFVVAVCGDTLVGFLVLGRCLLELYCVDLDAVFGVVEGTVEGEGIGGIDFAAFGMFGQGSEFSTGKGLESAV